MFDASSVSLRESLIYLDSILWPGHMYSGQALAMITTSKVPVIATCCGKDNDDYFKYPISSPVSNGSVHHFKPLSE